VPVDAAPFGDVHGAHGSAGHAKVFGRVMELESHTLVPVTTAVTHTQPGKTDASVRRMTVIAIPRMHPHPPEVLSILWGAEERTFGICAFFAVAPQYRRSFVCKESPNAGGYRRHPFLTPQQWPRPPVLCCRGAGADVLARQRFESDVRTAAGLRLPAGKAPSSCRSYVTIWPVRFRADRRR